MGLQSEIFNYVAVVAFFTTQSLFFQFAASDDIGPMLGVCYGTIANNLPTAPDVVTLFRAHKITKMRIYDPNPDTLNALRGTGISLTVGTRNEDIPNIASSLEGAAAWVKTHIDPYKDSVIFSYVLIGNEVIPGPFAADIAPAITNMITALKNIGLPDVRVSTTTYENLQISFPPSAGIFAPDVGQIMKDVTTALRKNTNHTSLHVSLYPYYASSTPNDVTFEYATFRAPKPVVDGPHQYYGILDAQIDSYHAALEKIGAGDIGIIVTETGWPTAGNAPFTSVGNAHIFNSNLYKRVMTGKGTPKWPDVPLEVFIFAMFDENLKGAGIEQNWGLFTPNLVQKYPLMS